MESAQGQVAAKFNPAGAWKLALGREICTDIQAGLDHEWLVTNGLGGYASGSIIGATTRSYHGLLVAAMHPPVDRQVLISKIDEEVELQGGGVLKLGVNEYQDGTIEPRGLQYLEKVMLQGDHPCFHYRLEPQLILEKRIWMEYGQNTTYVQYRLLGTFRDQTHTELLLRLIPYCLSRDHHATTEGENNWHFLVESRLNRCVLQAAPQLPVYQMVASPAVQFTSSGRWYWKILHRRELERGLKAVEDVYQPGIFSAELKAGETLTLVLSAEHELHPDLGNEQHEEAISQALIRHKRRQKQLLAVADRTTEDLARRDPVYARLVLAADQFIVTRPKKSNGDDKGFHLSPDRKTIIAGYPWFTDWGRDSMISLPGLLLYTGRYSEARGLFKAFTSYVHEGLIPNRFPDQGDTPEYNTADATLWLFRALDIYVKTTGDWTLLKDLFPILREIIQWHIQGTAFGIGIDPRDGLLRAGAPGLQLTWMDAKVDNWVVTPRRGKPVEINALWYNALSCMESWAVRLSFDATRYGLLRSQICKNFATRYWYPEGNYLYDVLDVDGVDGQNDTSLRPNQLFVTALSHELVSESKARKILQVATKELLTPLGLRTLSPRDPAYQKHFNGDRNQRDSAYHQGTSWPWLIGAYIDTHLWLNNDREALRPLLQPLIRHLWDGCLGSVCEVVEPEPPFRAAGCFAQAWSVAELLRCWLLLSN
jgi:predicted glycogen debranching enzyme